MNHMPRVRFAPSPTGELHLGGARTALFNFLYARQKGGKFYLRIEDTDVQRSRNKYVHQICDSLKWLNLHWDEPIVFQSHRKETHHSDIRTLLNEGKAYRCFCSVEELAKEREEASKAKISYKYSQKCRDLSSDEVMAKLNRAEPFCIRIKIPPGKTKFVDGVYGEIAVNNKEIDDFIIQRTDGNPTYNLTVVVDDLYMEITMVIRGEDHLANTPKQIIIYKALGGKRPRFAHLPMILTENGQRLSKRHGATGVHQYQAMGYMPEALLNYLALLGWSPTSEQEVFTLNELIEEFSLNRVVKKGAVFDEKKLHWMGGQHMARKTSQYLFESMREIHGEWHPEVDNAYILNVLELVKTRTKSLQELDEFTGYFFHDPQLFDEKAVKKSWKDESVNYYLEKYANQLNGVQPWEVAMLEENLRAAAKELEISAGQLIHPIRIAITGFGIGPPLFDIMALLERETVMRRLKFAIETLPSS